MPTSFKQQIVYIYDLQLPMELVTSSYPAHGDMYTIYIIVTYA